MKRSLSSCLLLVSLFAPAAASAGGVGYARASSQLKSDTKASLFTPLNVLDGRENTVWCEGADGDGVGESILVGFRGPTAIDEVRITTGDARDEASFKAHGRVKGLDIKTSESSHSFVVVDNQEAQSFKFEKSIEVERLTLEIGAATKGEGEEASATCLADVVFLSKGKPINGTWLESKLRYEKGRATMMGTWYGGPTGARDKFLDFYSDGTWHYSFRPFDPEIKRIEIGGDYAFDGSHLRMKMPGKGWVDLRTRPFEKDGTSYLEVEEKAEKTLAGKWTDKP